MAISLVDQAASFKYWNLTSSPLSYNSVYAWTFWFYATRLTGNQCLITICDNDINNYDLFYLEGSTIRIEPSIAGTYDTQGSGTISLNTWYWGAMVRASSTSLAGYINGSLIGTSTLNISGRGASDRMEAGILASIYIPFEGRFGAMKAWSASSFTVVGERFSIIPRAYTNLYGYWPTFTGGSSERVRDYSGNNHPWTENGSIADAAGPPVTFGIVVPALPVFVAGGGTTYNQSVSGSVTPAGALVNQPQTILAGAIAPAGSLLKSVITAFTGSVTPAGALANLKLTPLSIAGSISPTGSLVNQAQTTLNGAITSAGALANRVATSFSGSITPSGGLSNQLQTLFGGSITSAGGLVNQVGKLFNGSITATGAITNQVSKAVAGAITPAGSLVHRVSIAFSGSITPSGALDSIKITLLSIAGSITPSGSLLNQAQKVFAGSVAPAGALVKQVVTILTGAVAPGGTLGNLRQVFVSLAGAVAPSGNLASQVNKLVSGSIAPAGVLIKEVKKNYPVSLRHPGSFRMCPAPSA